MHYAANFWKIRHHWKEIVKIPDISDWGWEEEAKAVTLDPRFSHEMSLVNGFWFERLISSGIPCLVYSRGILPEDCRHILHPL